MPCFIRCWYSHVSSHIRCWYSHVSSHIRCWYSHVSSHIRCWYSHVSSHQMLVFSCGVNCGQHQPLAILHTDLQVLAVLCRQVILYTAACACVHVCVYVCVYVCMHVHITVQVKIKFPFRIRRTLVVLP